MGGRGFDLPAMLFQRRRWRSGMRVSAAPDDKGAANVAMLFQRDRGRRGVLAGWRGGMFGWGDRAVPREDEGGDR